MYSSHFQILPYLMYLENVQNFVFYRSFGAKPLEDVVKNLRTVIMTELEAALAQQAPPAPVGDPTR